MIGGWLVYGAFVSLFVALGARAAESLGRLLGYPVRWVWAGALMLTVLVIGVAPFRATAPAEQPPVITASPVGATLVVSHRSWWTRARAK